MALFARRERPPAAVQALLTGDERTLAFADTADGTTVLASTRGLWWPGHGRGDLGDDAAARLMLWQRIDKVVWRDGVLMVIEADVLDDRLLVDRPPVRVMLTVPRELPAVVRKRVEANIVRTELAGVDGGAVRFVGRREPGRDGVTWWARLEPGTRATEPVLSAISARLELLRASAQAD